MLLLCAPAALLLASCTDADLPSSPELLSLKKVGQTPISVTPSSGSIASGKTIQLSAIDGNGQTVSNARWSSSNNGVATVSSSGLVTGVSAGSATITASSGNRSGTATVTTTSGSTTVATVTLSPSSVSLVVGATGQLSATAKDASGNTLSGQTFAWSSSNTVVATVSSAGVVTAQAAGSATITATSGGRSGSSAITVTSPTNSPAPGTPDFSAIKRGIRPRGFGASTYVLSQPAVGGTLYYVSTTGNDANSGSSSAPFRTINRAAQVAQAGDVVTIRSGTYQESVFVANSGTADKRIVFQAESRGVVVLSGGRFTFQPKDWYGILGASRQTHITVKGLIFRQYAENVSGKHALRTARGWIVDDCLFDNAGYTGVQINDHDVTIVRSTMQYHFVHAFAVSGGGGGTSASDQNYRPVERFRLIDVVVRGNYTTTQTTTATAATRVAKIVATRGTVVDNVHFLENNGGGLWFDSQNTNFRVSNSYFSANRGHTDGNGYQPATGRGLYLEKNWAGGVIENNLIVGNSGVGIFLVNTNGLVIRNNLVAQNDLCISYVNMTTAGYELFTLKNIQILNNQCKDWAKWSAIHAMGGTFTTPWEMNIYADGNTYEPVRAAAMAWWPSPVNGANTIPQVQSQFRWEKNGRVGSIRVP